MIWCLLFSSNWLLMFGIPCQFFLRKITFQWRGGGVVQAQATQAMEMEGRWRRASSGGRASDGELMKFCSPAAHLVLCGLGVVRRGLLGREGPLLHHKPVVMWRRCGVGEAFSSRVIGSRPLVSLGFWTELHESFSGFSSGVVYFPSPKSLRLWYPAGEVLVN